MAGLYPYSKGQIVVFDPKEFSWLHETGKFAEIANMEDSLKDQGVKQASC